MTQKKIVKIIILTCVLFGLWKISPWLGELRADKTTYDEYIGYVDEIRLDFAEQMLNEMGLVYSGNSGQMHEKVEKIGMQFNAYRRATVEEARSLQVLVMDRLVAAINAHPKLQPFLDESPFTFKRVTVSISFEGPNGRYADGSIGRIFNISDLAGAVENRNKLFYFTHDPFTTNNIDHLEESYEEAKKLVADSPIQNPAVHQNTPIEEAIDEILPLYVKKMRKEYDLKCWAIGGKGEDYVEEIGSKFSVEKHVTQEEARKVILAAAESLLQDINSNEKLRPYLREFPFPIERVKMRISFTKPNGYSYDDGSMESVTVEGNEVTYFQQPPIGKTLSVYPVLVPVYAKESYQEALHLLNTHESKNQRSK